MDAICKNYLTGIIFVFGLLAMIPGIAWSEDAADRLGNWFGVNSTIRFSDHWSAFAQGEMRLWEPASNLNETLFRFAGHYDFNKIAMAGLGYVRVDTWAFENGDGRIREENRLYQQFALKQAWARVKFEHRFRLEQRWFECTGNDYSNRVRYKFGITIPVNYETVKPGAFYVKFLNETFIEFDGGDRDFDQNRFVVAGGHQFTSASKLQIGLLWQARSSQDFFRMQFYYTQNFDLRKRRSPDNRRK